MFARGPFEPVLLCTYYVINEFNDLKGLENINDTVVKYGSPNDTNIGCSKINRV